MGKFVAVGIETLTPWQLGNSPLRMVVLPVVIAYDMSVVSEIEMQCI